MFQKLLMEDFIKIEPTNTDLGMSLNDAINKKFTNKVLINHGIGIRNQKIVKIMDKKLVHGFLVIHVKFILITYKLLNDEIVEAFISKQDETGISLTHLIVNVIFVNQLFPDTIMKYFMLKDSSDKQMCWCWTYKDNNFYFKTEQKVKCKIVSIKYNSFLIEERMNDHGLGPVDWW